MLSRRIIRIKVMQSLYAHFQGENPEMNTSEKFLFGSIDKIYDIYLYLLLFPAEFRHYVRMHFADDRVKHIPDAQQEKLVNLIINNSLIEMLETNLNLQHKSKKIRFSWTGQQDLFRYIFLELGKDEKIQAFLKPSTDKYKTDKDFLLYLFGEFFSHSEHFQQHMEETDIHWSDDKSLVEHSVYTTIQKMLPESTSEFLLDLSKDLEEDMEFARRLFRKTIMRNEEFEILISEKTRNWDVERIAVIDIILLKMALCELLEFTSIPVKVSINEYLEISKLYSTPKSNSFINGVLDSLQIELKQQEKINKTGRGLLE
jgi:N utilization substance protein B